VRAALTGQTRTCSSSPTGSSIGKAPHRPASSCSSRGTQNPRPCWHFAARGLAAWSTRDAQGPKASWGRGPRQERRQGGRPARPKGTPTSPRCSCARQLARSGKRPVPQAAFAPHSPLRLGHDRCPSFNTGEVSSTFIRDERPGVRRARTCSSCPSRKGLPSSPLRHPLARDNNARDVAANSLVQTLLPRRGRPPRFQLPKLPILAFDAAG